MGGDPQDSQPTNRPQIPGDQHGRPSGLSGFPVFMALLGVAGLLLKRPLVGLLGDFFISYWGNLSASFAVYFIVALSNFTWRWKRLAVAALALLVVELFELTDGFGVMSNTCDPWDLLANLCGVSMALGADRLARSAKGGA
jgi:hypothetical protein